MESLGAELKAEVDRRCALLVQQLQQQEAVGHSEANCKRADDSDLGAGLC